MQGDAGGDGVAVPGEDHTGGLPEPVVQADVLLGAVAVVAKGVAADIELRPAVALQKAGHAAAVVVVPVGEDGVIRSFQVDAKLLCVVREGPALARVEEKLVPVRLNKQTQAVLGGEIGGNSGVFNECGEFHIASCSQNRSCSGSSSRESQ